MDAQSAGDGVPWTGWRRGSCVSRNDDIALRSRWPPRSAVTEARVVHMCPGSCLISNYYLVACRFQPKNLMTHHSRRSGSLRATSACIASNAVRARYERHDGTHEREPTALGCSWCTYIMYLSTGLAQDTPPICVMSIGRVPGHGRYICC
jgi:hypothetical protein